jgi:hypothetical protein
MYLHNHPKSYLFFLYLQLLLSQVTITTKWNQSLLIFKNDASDTTISPALDILFPSLYSTHFHVWATRSIRRFLWQFYSQKIYLKQLSLASWDTYMVLIYNTNWFTLYTCKKSLDAKDND